MEEFNYGYARALAGVSVDGAIVRVTEALAREGFGVLTRIDVKETLAQKLGVEVAPYVILGACNPQLAHRAITEEPEIGLLLPCNIVVREDVAGARVSIADPRAMFRIVDKPGLEAIAGEVDARLRRVLAAL